ncbi:Armadillo-like helical [Niveomyces insectorum RCEF 264]|uniref:Armadillo-like helical n=1 Tax=Niveomyces insectorum RCEF 264 TaxID=1081102 RepID=A0A167X3V2_9HYPO|nr:Armadillo-like helical [Niveomyces insectorum RCEF 264]
MAWQPAPDSLRTLIGCVKNSHNGFDKVSQKQAEIMLREAKKSPDFNNYLAYIFSSAAPPTDTGLSSSDYNLVRAAAGIMLKNAIKLAYKQTPDTSIALIKAAVLLGLQDQSPQVRNGAGNIATELIQRGGVYAWPELLNELLLMVGNVSGQVAPATQEAAMSALAKICEDNNKLLEREHNGQRPLNVLLPKLVEATASPLPKVRAGALTAINEFIPRKSQAMLASIDVLLQQLFTLAADPSNDVRREVCRAFVYLVETRADKLLPHVAGLVDYFLVQQKNEQDEDLACQAVEFWLSAGEHHDFWKSLQPYAPKIVRSLLEGMVYSGEDIALLGSASDDEDEDDRAEDIRPQFAKHASKRNANGGTGANASTADKGANNAYEKLADMDDGGLEDGEVDEGDGDGDGDGGDDSDDIDGEDEGYIEGSPEEHWTLRKGSAAALDVLARDFGASMFEWILPYLTTNLKHEDWPHRESAVLALGAVAEGCVDAVTPHLPELIPYLTSLLNDPEPLVRQITCWTLARYSVWAIGLTDPAQVAAYFVPMMEGFLNLMLDRNKKVQEAAASAMATLEEKAGKKLEPYAGPIIQRFIGCFDKYKDRNMYILYDCVQTLAEAIGPVLALPALSGQLMPALFKRYDSVPDQSRELFPLLECFSYVAMSLGSAFGPFAQPVFRRCVNIIHQNLEQSLAAAGNTHLDPPDKDFLVTSLDLISAIVQALAGDKAAALVTDTQPAFFELLSFCMEDPTDEVRQSAYAVLGDCAKFVFPQLQPCLGNLLPILLKQLDMDNILDEEIDAGFSIINNACWSMGEIAIRHGKGMAPYVHELLKSCVEILTNPRVPRGVNENAAIALGRLGLANADALAPNLHTFAAEFLVSMDDVDPTEEKATALQGFTLVVAQNPQAMEKVLLHYFQTIATYEDINLQSPIKQELHDVFQNIISTYRRLIPQLDTFLAQLSANEQASLRRQYQI